MKKPSWKNFEENLDTEVGGFLMVAAGISVIILAVILCELTTWWLMVILPLLILYTAYKAALAKEEEKE